MKPLPHSLLLALLSGIAAIAASARPNIVFILADDMGYDSVSANNPAMGPLKTPHIDRLIRQGMNFHDAHSGSAVCTPTRYGLLTGRYCWRTKLKNSVLWSWGAPLIEDERLTVAELLQQNGYATGMVGKWHLGMSWLDAEGMPANAKLQLSDAHFRKGAGAKRVAEVATRIDFTKPVRGGPVDHGFDYYFGVDVPNFPPYTWIENDRLTAQPTVPKPKTMFGAPGPMQPGWKLEDILKGLGDRAAQWIGEQAKAEKPFFLYLPLTSPHAPISPSEAWQGKSGISIYADFLLETDHVVGQVMQALDEAGCSEDTLLIFSCDNGTANFARFAELEKKGIDLKHTFKGQKAQIHEGGHRVPFVARWPKAIKAGSRCDETICLNDFMATVAELLGAKLPAGSAEDSTSILPLLKGEATALPDRPWVVNHDIGGNFAIRKGPWKLVAGKSPRLFNLDADPKEAKNVAADHPELVTELKDRLASYRNTGYSVKR